MRTHARSVAALTAILVVIATLSLPIAYQNRNIIREKYELAFVGSAPCTAEAHQATGCPEYIAHGGGDINGEEKTSSFEALNLNYEKGFRFFELDFNWTSDGELVAIHDWHKSKVTTFGGEPSLMSLREFRQAKSLTGLSQMTLDDVANWIRDGHADAYIVTDIKKNNLSGLRRIASRYQDVKKNFIPQIYRFCEMAPARELKFRQVILTLYAAEYTESGILTFVDQQRPYAITMPPHKANADFLEKLNQIQVMTYTHGVNDAVQQEQMRSLGIRGFYTNALPGK